MLAYSARRIADWFLSWASIAFCGEHADGGHVASASLCRLLAEIPRPIATPPAATPIAILRRGVYGLGSITGCGASAKPRSSRAGLLTISGSALNFGTS